MMKGTFISQIAALNTKEGKSSIFTMFNTQKLMLIFNSLHLDLMNQSQDREYKFRSLNYFLGWKFNEMEDTGNILFYYNIYEQKPISYTILWSFLLHSLLDEFL